MFFRSEIEEGKKSEIIDKELTQMIPSTAIVLLTPCFWFSMFKAKKSFPLEISWIVN